MGTDATRCAKCGGEFGSKRIHIDGDQYHPGCAIMSYPSHTPEDASRTTGEICRLRAALEYITEHHTDMQACLTKAREALNPSA